MQCVSSTPHTQVPTNVLSSYAKILKEVQLHVL